ncbi:hypothetical protein PGT21_014626 [Puccinia graminis f. sp. tritici]|uniref:Uncharacterized protein n=1 Tax=Puccinia graminis f. sp. tritici TaxID=56615 RepID=A0A5B0N4B5_PUCGR|nr:hypothetical protein PGT21_014626 [Puccinia graminis f. sp. tritici]
MRKQKNHSMFINFSIYLGIDQRGGRPEESDGKAAGNNDEREGSSRTIFESEGYYKDRVGTDDFLDDPRFIALAYLLISITAQLGYPSSEHCSINSLIIQAVWSDRKNSSIRWISSCEPSSDQASH